MPNILTPQINTILRDQFNQNQKSNLLSTIKSEPLSLGKFFRNKILEIQSNPALLDVSDITNFLKNVLSYYKAYTEKNPNYSITAEEFVDTVESTFLAIQLEHQTEFSELELSTARTNFITANKEWILEQVTTNFNSYLRTRSNETFASTLEYFNYVVDSYGGFSNEVKTLFGRLKSDITQLSLAHAKQLQEALPLHYKRKLNHEDIVDAYRRKANGKMNIDEFNEAKIWYAIAYVLTQDENKAINLYEELCDQASQSSMLKNTSSNNSTGRSILQAELEQAVVTNDTAKLALYGIDRITSASRLFDYYCQMFAYDKSNEFDKDKKYKEEIVNKVTLLPGNGTTFVLQDKARAALTYWTIYAKESSLDTASIFTELETFIKSAEHLKDDARQFLFDELQKMGMPQNCIEAFPKPRSSNPASAVADAPRPK